MLEAKDYLDFMGTLFQVEQEIATNCEQLLEIAKEPKAQETLIKIVKDQKHHQELVQEMMALIA